jgi:uncharacterized protein
MKSDEGVGRRGSGRLAENVMHFARVLRRAGLPAGPDKVIDALRALDIAGVGRRDDFYWTLASVFIDRRAQLELFDQAFHIFWRDPRLLARVMQLLLPKVHGRARPEAEKRAPGGRVAAALPPPAGDGNQSAPAQEEALEAALTFSSREVLQRKDFESMSPEEFADARAAVASMRLHLRPAPARRYRPDARGPRADPRATLRASLSSGGAFIPLERRKRVRRAPPLVALCDISGSMSRYTRMFLLFLHAAANECERMHALTFGTRLTHVTRHLRHRDADVALEALSRAVPDWAGGTRIGACLHEFNLSWSRRLLAQGAVVLLVSDGLDREAGAGLELEMQRLRRSCRKLIWLNPLLRYAGFEPRAAGIRAMLPHVDAFLPVHNLQSLSDLGAALSQAGRDATVLNSGAA